MNTADLYSDENIRAREDKMTTRNLDAMLALPVELRADAYAEAHYTMNMIGGRPSDALGMAIRTVRERGGRPATDHYGDMAATRMSIFGAVRAHN